MDFIEVFIILGNHDCFNNKNRLDALSGILHVKKYSNVHLLKDSGIYSYGNVVFGVSSILDGNIVKCPMKLENRHYIGLYHGIVSSCSLDNNYKANNGVSIENFENYDIVMLGDVHKRQFLNKEQTIAYPGSLIQQNFKEEVDHGFLLWDLENKKSTFVKLDNQYCFLDLDSFGNDHN
jgi:DNA repair exonuclease SbcCD nuclease subunit